MAAALSIAFLLTFSVIVVRISSVAMRLTGISDNVARFQCISAFTGAGFTTNESEMIVNYPVRRRILVLLMIIGNLGIASFAATLIVSFVAKEPQPGTYLWQAMLLLITIVAIITLMSNKTLDRVLCGTISTILTRYTSLAKRRYHRILQLDNEINISEHLYTDPHPRQFLELSQTDHPLRLLAIRCGETREFHQSDNEGFVKPGDIMICYGDESGHDVLEARMSQFEEKISAHTET